MKIEMNTRFERELGRSNSFIEGSIFAFRFSDVKEKHGFLFFDLPWNRSVINEFSLNFVAEVNETQFEYNLNKHYMPENWIDSTLGLWRNFHWLVSFAVHLKLIKPHLPIVILAGFDEEITEMNMSMHHLRSDGHYWVEDIHLYSNPCIRISL